MDDIMFDRVFIVSEEINVSISFLFTSTVALNTSETRFDHLETKNRLNNVKNRPILMFENLTG